MISLPSPLLSPPLCYLSLFPLPHPGSSPRLSLLLASLHATPPSSPSSLSPFPSAALPRWGRTYLLVPVLHQANEALQLGWTILQEVSLQLCEAGGELAFFPQFLALLDELDIDFRIRSVTFGQLTCWE